MNVIKPTKTQLRPKQRVSGFVDAPQEEQSKTEEVHLQQPVITQVEVKNFTNDGRYVLMSDIPSNYSFYDFKELWVRPFTPNEARLLHMARVSGNLMYLVSAIDACLSQPISRLIIEDFEFILYWLRLNSYPSKPFSVTWTCDNALEYEDIETPSGSCMKENITVINRSNMNVVYLDQNYKVPKGMTFPTMGIFNEVWSLKKALEGLDENDLNYEQSRDDILGDIYLMNIAQWIDQGLTAQEKLQILKDSSDLAFQEKLEAAIDEIPDFGVSESLDVQCEECGGVTKRRLRVDYLTFFP
jgi:hypothetical protein